MTNRFTAIAAMGSLLALAACSQEPDQDKVAAASSASASMGTTQVAVGAGGVSGPAAVARAGSLLDCNGPVTRTATYKSLSATYKNDAQLGTIPGAEGADAKGLLLYDMDPARKLEVSFWDAAMQHVANIAPGDKAVAWTGPQGIHVGSTLAYIQGVNGKPFSISGFGWDYGGYVVDFQGGRLDKLAGGCKLTLRFGDPDSHTAMPAGVSGDGVTLSSDDPRLKKWMPQVDQMSIGWPLPPGVKADGDSGGGD